MDIFLRQIAISCKSRTVRQRHSHIRRQECALRGRLYCFYRAMLCIRGTSHGPVSVRLSVRPSVTSRCSTKTAKRRITQTTPHASPGTLVF